MACRSKMLTWLGLLAFLLLPPSLRAEDGLYALVFGNGNYAHMGKLESAVTDARTFATLLNRSGFSLPFGNDPTTGASLNLTRDEMQAQIVQLRSSGVLDRASIVVFYFAGHGGQAGNDVYVLGTGAVVEPAHSDSDLEKSGISLRNIAADLKPKGGKGLIAVVDACRVGQGAVTSNGVSDEDVLAVFSTSAGKTAKSGVNGRASVFTQTLADALANKQTWNEAISSARITAQNAHGQQPKAIYDPTGPLASFRMNYRRPSLPTSSPPPPMTATSSGKTYDRPMVLTKGVMKSLTLRDSPSGADIGSIFQNGNTYPVADCAPEFIVVKDGLSWLPVRCSGWVLQKHLVSGKQYIELEAGQFTVVDHPDHKSIKLRYETSLNPKAILELRPQTTGVALDKWTTQEGYDWRMVQIEAWVLVEGKDGKRFVQF